MVRWLFLMFLYGCNFDSKDTLPKVDHIQVSTTFQRFELAMFSGDMSFDSLDLKRLKDSFPEFSEVYFQEIIPAEDLSFVDGFVKNENIQKLFQKTLEEYPTLEFYESDCRKALQFLKFYFPEIEVPHITTYISEYQIGSFIYGNNNLAVGLDFFLGSDYPYAEFNPGNTSFSEYMTRTFNKDHLVMKTMAPLVEDLVGAPEGQNLLDLMIHEGKKMLVKDKILPFVSDTIIMEVSNSQWEWLNDNEFDIWAFFLDEQLIYSSDWRKIRKYVEYSPHSPGMPLEAPGRTAGFVGWKILENFWKRNPEMSLSQILLLKDAQKILDSSRYKPLKR